jgi:hypothetical protein
MISSESSILSDEEKHNINTDLWKEYLEKLKIHEDNNSEEIKEEKIRTWKMLNNITLHPSHTTIICGPPPNKIFNISENKMPTYEQEHYNKIELWKNYILKLNESLKKNENYFISCELNRANEIVANSLKYLNEKKYITLELPPTLIL